MASWRYEILLLVLKKYFTRSLRSLLKYFSTLEEKLRISARPCNILYVFFWFSVSSKDIVDFHCTVIRSVLEYCSPIFHHSLLDCLSERVQKKALSIIAPDKSYKHCLVSFGLSTIYDRRNDQCIKLFNSISSDQHKLACLCFLRTTKATTIPDSREFTTCPTFARKAAKIRSNQPCEVVQTFIIM